MTTFFLTRSGDLQHMDLYFWQSVRLHDSPPGDTTVHLFGYDATFENLCYDAQLNCAWRSVPLFHPDSIQFSSTSHPHKVVLSTSDVRRAKNLMIQFQDQNDPYVKGSILANAIARSSTLSKRVDNLSHDLRVLLTGHEETIRQELAGFSKAQAGFKEQLSKILVATGTSAQAGSSSSSRQSSALVAAAPSLLGATGSMIRGPSMSTTNSMIRGPPTISTGIPIRGPPTRMPILGGNKNNVVPIVNLVGERAEVLAGLQSGLTAEVLADLQSGLTEGLLAGLTGLTADLRTELTADLTGLLAAAAEP